jgi:O-antigen ligase
MTTNLVLLAIALSVVLNERLYVRFATAGSGLVRVMDLAIPVIAALVVILSRHSIMPRFRNNRNLRYSLPYLLLGLMLPVLGVFGGGYPWRTLLTAIVSIRALALIVLGIWLAGQPPRARVLAARWMVVCILFEAFIAACQFITLKNLVNAPLLQWLYQWDIQTMTDYKAAYLVTGRSSGTFLGANSLGVWGVIAAWFAVTFLSGPLRLACTAASLLTLVLSQSRGSIAAFLASLLLAALFLPWMKRRDRLGLATAALVTIVLGAVALASGGALQNEALQTEDMQRRFISGFDVLFEGASADANAASRVEAWGDSISFFREHPLGTWGEPQVLVDLIDNQYVSTMLQGSLPFAAALLLALYGGLQKTKNPVMRSFLALITVSIAVNGISATPFQYPAIGIYWLALGYSALPLSNIVLVARRPHTRVPGVLGGSHARLQPDT